MKSVLEISSLILLAIVGASTSVGAQRQGPGRQQQQQDGQTAQRYNSAQREGPGEQQQQQHQAGHRRDGPSKNSINRINQVINRILDRPTPTNGKDSTMMMMMMLMMSQLKNTKLKTDTKLKNETACGVDWSSKFIGGNVTRQSQIQWQCNFYDDRMNWYRCSGTIINCDPTIIVSAASCFANKTKPHFVICGDWRIDWNDAHEERREVIEVTNHPSFNAATFNNDIAVVKVNESMPCSLGKIWPACLPNTANYEYLDWKDTTVSGWGQHSTGETSNKLKYVKVYPIPDSECIRHGPKEKICTASDVEAGACYGDKGGPLVTKATDVDSGYSLIGITLDTCANSDSFISADDSRRKNSYTEFSWYMKWVADQFEMTLE